MNTNNAHIITAMSKIVAETMTSFQSDFENYDRKYIESEEDTIFPLIWIVGKCHTILLNLAEFEKNFAECEGVRYSYAQGGDPYTLYLDSYGGDRIFLINSEGLAEITEKQAREIIRDITIPVVENWKKEHGPLPHNFKMTIRFKNISLTKLKEMFRAEEKYNGNTLIKAIRGIRDYRKTADNHYYELSYNPGYNEFIFCEYYNGQEGLVGGIVFHGWPETGYQENYAVQLSPSYGWSRHT